MLYDWPLKYSKEGWGEGTRGWEKERKPWSRRRKRKRRRMYRASGNPRRSYIFLRERLSLQLRSAIALRYAITRIYWCIIPPGWRGEEESMHRLYTNSKSIHETLAAVFFQLCFMEINLWSARKFLTYFAHQSISLKIHKTQNKLFLLATKVVYFVL